MSWCSLKNEALGCYLVQDVSVIYLGTLGCTSDSIHALALNPLLLTL